MAELGQTKDPKELVPGNPESVSGVADTLRKKATTMQGVADDLGNVRVPNWGGKASNAFWDRFTPEKGNWELGHDAMDGAAKALDDHSSALSKAQSGAADAIDLWERGEQATKQAVADFEAKGGVISGGIDPSAPPGSANGPIPRGGEFSDPGAKLRQQAVETLERARNQLKEAGDTAAAAIDKHGGKADNAPGWLAGPAKFVEKKGPEKAAMDIKATESWAEKAERKQGEGSRFAKYGQWGEKFEQRPGVNVTLAGAKAEANLFSTSASGATMLGDATAAGKAEFKALGAEAAATGGVSGHGVTGQAKAGAYLAQAGAQGDIRYGHAGVGGSAKGMVGAEAAASGSVGADGVRANVGAFAGAKAEAEVHGDVGGIGAGVKGEAWAGAGAEAGVTVGEGKDGKWHIGAEAGIGLGVGAKVGFEFTVDPGEVTDTVGDAASAINPFD